MRNSKLIYIKFSTVIKDTVYIFIGNKFLLRLCLTGHIDDLLILSNPRCFNLSKFINYMYYYAWFYDHEDLCQLHIFLKKI